MKSYCFYYPSLSLQQFSIKSSAWNYVIGLKKRKTSFLFSYRFIVSSFRKLNKDVCTLKFSNFSLFRFLLHSLCLNSSGLINVCIILDWLAQLDTVDHSLHFLHLLSGSNTVFLLLTGITFLYNSDYFSYSSPLNYPVPSPWFILLLLFTQ